MRAGRAMSTVDGDGGQYACVYVPFPLLVLYVGSRRERGHVRGESGAAGRHVGRRAKLGSSE